MHSSSYYIHQVNKGVIASHSPMTIDENLRMSQFYPFPICKMDSQLWLLYFIAPLSFKDE